MIPRMLGGWAEAPVCVLGMGRSGTSLTMRLLNLLGVHLGPEEGLIDCAPPNSRGYWERHGILELNDAVLRAMGGDYANPPELERGWQRSAALTVLKQRGQALVDECFADKTLWGFKDPRTSFTLPFWREVVPEMRYVICVRNPAEVAASFGRYPGYENTSDSDWERLWFRSIANALIATAGCERTLVFYEDYFSDLGAQIDRLSSFIGRPATPDAISAIEAFVERDMRHHWFSSESFVSDASRLPEARALFTLLRRTIGVDKELRAAERLARKLLVGGAWERLASSLKPTRQEAMLAPAGLRAFPADLATPGIRTFGIHRDGWLDRESYVALRGGGDADLMLRASVLPAPGQELKMLLNGNVLARVKAAAGQLELSMRIPPCRDTRHVELRWARSIRLGTPDERIVSALLEVIEVSDPAASLAALPTRLETVNSDPHGKLRRAARLRHVIGNGLSRERDAVENTLA